MSDGIHFLCNSYENLNIFLSYYKMIIFRFEKLDESESKKKKKRVWLLLRYKQILLIQYLKWIRTD